MSRLTFPEHPEIVKISLPGAKQFCACMAEDDPRQPYTDLFIDALLHWQRAQSLEEGCIGKDGVSTWECCLAHIQLGNDYDVLRQRENDADCLRWPGGQGRGDYQVASENWWRDLGFDLPRGAEVVDEDLGDHYVSTVIRKGLALAWIDALKEDDRRHRFLRLYKMFLQYQEDLQRLAATCPQTEGFPTSCCDSHRELAATWLVLEGYASRIQAKEERRPRDTWQDHPVLSQEWWAELVIEWRDGAVVVP